MAALAHVSWEHASNCIWTVACSHFGQAVRKSMTFSHKHRNLPSGFCSWNITLYGLDSGGLVHLKLSTRCFPSVAVIVPHSAPCLTHLKGWSVECQRYYIPFSDRLRNTGEINIAWVCLYFYCQPYSPLFSLTVSETLLYYLQREKCIFWLERKFSVRNYEFLTLINIQQIIRMAHGDGDDVFNGLVFQFLCFTVWSLCGLYYCMLKIKSWGDGTQFVNYVQEEIAVSGVCFGVHLWWVRILFSFTTE